MSSDDTSAAIRVDRLGKRYRLGQLGGADRFTEAASNLGRSLLRRVARKELDRGSDGRPAGNPTQLWALRDVSFSVGQGEVVGIIGSNGAGKTTLLKILARVTEPTEGKAEVLGRVGSLLEVGLGFHGDLTGRENIYLSGAILGLKRAEIDDRYDEIASFSGVEEFLGTPVKRYSSGMQARLAFAVAAHLEPDILLVDEVLAVGDVGFQRKCIGRMNEVAGEGRTVLFVTHNMAYLRALCERGILLERGHLVIDSTIDEAIGAYLSTAQQGFSENLSVRQSRRGTGEARLAQLSIKGEPAGNLSTALVAGRPAEFVFTVDRTIRGMSCDFAIYDIFGEAVASFTSGLGSSDDTVGDSKDLVFACQVDELLLSPGRYRVDAWLISRGDILDHVESAALFDVEEGIVRGRPAISTSRPGKALIPHRWTRPQSVL